MRRLAGAVIAMALGACASAAGSSPRGSGITPQPLCAFLDGRLDAWHGLARSPDDPLPDCVGSEDKADWLTFGEDRLHYRRFQRSGTATLIFDQDGEIVLLETFAANPDTVSHWVETLGPPERLIDYGAAQLLQRPLARRDEEVDELVWAKRGLALLRARSPSGDRLVRARGFAPMTASEYARRFVALRPIEYRDAD